MSFKYLPSFVALSAIAGFVLLVACSPRNESVKLRVAIPTQAQLAQAASAAPKQSYKPYDLSFLNSGGALAKNMTYVSASQLQAAASGTVVAMGSGSDWNSFLDPSSISQFNCFLVMAGGPGYDAASCSTTDGGTFSVGDYAGGVLSGATVEMIVPAGAARTFRVIGFQASSTSSCVDFHGNSGPDKSSLSHPHILGEVTQDISSGDVAVALNAKLDATTKKISDCSFGGNGSGGGGGWFGTGRDGDLVVPVSTTVNLDTTASVSAATNGTKLSSISKVTSLSAPSATSLDVTIVDNWSSRVVVDDEVMLYIVGESGNACGGQVWPGFSTSGRVVQINSTTDFVIDGIDARFATIPAASLNASAVQTSAGANTRVFCRLVAVRVPHFNNVILAGNSHISISSPLGSYNGTTHNGGLLAMRVNGVLSVNGSLNSLTVAAKGYAGGSYYKPGEGAAGQVNATSSASDWNAGGSSSGGGHGGAGGGNGGGIAIGDQYGCGPAVPDALMRCLMGKFFLGAGGGAATGGGGGVGGGIIRLLARAIDTSGGTLLVEASAGAGSYTGAAGGAGGSVFVQVQGFAPGSQGSSFSMVAKGGDGLSAGGGGGGRAHLQILDTSSAFVPAGNAVTGGAGTQVGSDGTCVYQLAKGALTDCQP